MAPHPLPTVAAPARPALPRKLDRAWSVCRSRRYLPANRKRRQRPRMDRSRNSSFPQCSGSAPLISKADPAITEGFMCTRFPFCSRYTLNRMSCASPPVFHVSKHALCAILISAGIRRERLQRNSSRSDNGLSLGRRIVRRGRIRLVRRNRRCVRNYARHAR